MPFENLYFRYDAFRDHNFNTFLDRLEPVPEEYIEARIREAVLAGKEIEPYFGPIIPLTLSPKSCASFIRTHPQLPISDRDYYFEQGVSIHVFADSNRT